LRKIIEDLSSRAIVKDARKALKVKNNATISSGNPSNKEVWTEVLSKEASVEVFPYLCDLKDKNLPVASLIGEIMSFASKDVHTGQVDRVLIDNRSLSPDQVSV
jgi:tetrahydromethanopterin S-methyltransferase subunit H